MTSRKEPALSWIDRLHAGHKLIISLLIAVAAYFLIPAGDLNLLTHIMLGWDTGCFSMIVMSWATFFTIKPE